MVFCHICSKRQLCALVKFKSHSLLLLSIWGRTKSWMWRQPLLFLHTQRFSPLPCNNEVNSYYINLTLQLFFSLPLESAALFLCYCVFLCNYAAEGYSRRLDYTVTPDKNINFFKIGQSVVCCNVEPIWKWWHFFQVWIMFIRLVEWKQYAVNWGNKHALLVCRKQQIQSKSCIWMV